MTANLSIHEGVHKPFHVKLEMKKGPMFVTKTEIGGDSENILKGP